jgi:hypothetical protein
MIRVLAATQPSTRVPVVLASAGGSAPRPSYPLRHCMDRARIVSFWRHNPEISDILCGLNNTGVAVRDRDG